MRALLILAFGLMAAFTAPSFGGEKKEKLPKDLKITLDVPKDAPALADANGGRFAVMVNIENTGKEDVVLWPYLRMEVKDAKGKEVERSIFIGRWGLVSAPSIIEDIPFVTLKPGKTHKIEAKISSFGYDADAITGWRLPSAGDYVLSLQYSYDRAVAKKTYGRNCKDIDRDTAPWNRAIEVEKKLDVKLSVK